VTAAATVRPGPRVVAVGGGHGLAATIRAVRRYASRVTAVVATADDGGSTGRLRSALDMPAPGDIRRCIEAMAGPEGTTLARALGYRFGGSDVEGHALGNLLLAGLHAVTGDFGAAVDPPGAAAPAEAVEAVLGADQVVLGPGSLFTSVLAAAVVEDVRDALKRTAARRVYVCNVRAEAGETRGYDVAAHVAALRRHGIEPDVVVAQRGALPLGDVGAEVVEADVVRPHGLAHDPARLGDVLAGLAT
jgi:2-phospho-L-lactate transferase/gluconeogenesis factor (CofD/UPF0052 family)